MNKSSHPILLYPNGDCYEVVDLRYPLTTDRYLADELRVMEPNTYPPMARRPILHPTTPPSPITDPLVEAVVESAGDLRKLIKALLPLVRDDDHFSERARADWANAIECSLASAGDALDALSSSSKGERYYAEEREVWDGEKSEIVFVACDPENAKDAANLLNSMKGND